MQTYLSTFISGLQEPVEFILKKYIPNVKVLNLLDGLIVYETETDAGKIGFRCFNNSFLVMKQFSDLGGNPMNSMFQIVADSKGLEENISENIKDKAKSFRIIASRENKLVSVDKKLLELVEMRISKVKGLKIDRSKPDIEFWFLYRSERLGFFMMRLTKHKAYEKILHKGELRPELSHILCSISEPDADDIFLDPFCGYGSIPIERALSFSYNMIFAIDRDREKIKNLRQKIKESKYKKMKRSFLAKSGDSLNLDTFETHFIDRIVTDPPWGLFKDVGMNIAEFYPLMLKEFYRVLKTRGIIVVVTAEKEEFENSILKFGNNMELEKKYNILVSGKKAAVYKIIKVK